MIKSIHLKHYKSYKNTKIVFHKRINAIIGDGLAGKSNIPRAIELVRSFRPINNKNLSNFASEGTPSEITINLKEGFSIYLKKGIKNAIYKIFFKGEEKHVFRKINKHVPLEVENILNLRGINYQRQLDSPFIISDSPGKITKIINDITKVSSVDNWLKAINKEISGYNVILKDAEKEYVNVAEKLKHLDEIKNVEPLLKKIKKMEVKIKKLEDELYDIESTVAEINISKRKIKYYKNALKAEDKIEEIKSIDKKIASYEKEFDLLVSFINSKEKIKKLKKMSKEKIKSLISSLKKMKLCPTCLAVIDNKTIRKIKNEINRAF